MVYLLAHVSCFPFLQVLQHLLATSTYVEPCRCSSFTCLASSDSVRQNGPVTPQNTSQFMAFSLVTRTLLQMVLPFMLL